jgi:RHS repeat-associated protein
VLLPDSPADLTDPLGELAALSESDAWDRNGNMILDGDFAYVYDAWNNLVAVKSQADADVAYATYRFFADDRRASKAVTHRGELDTTLYFLYDGPEVIEERDGSEAVVQQYVYGPRHIDDLAMIRGRNGTSFVHTDANGNVIGLTTPAGLLAEEYNYTPYGRMLARRHTGFGDADGDGDVDAADQTAWNATQGGGGVYNRNLDADYDGDNDFYDESAWLASYNAPGTSAIVPHRAWSPSGNPYGFTARRLDPESMLMHYRLRTYSPTLKRFMQRDPLGYIDGPSLYEYVAGNPLRYLDPWGRWRRNADGSLVVERTGEYGWFADPRDDGRYDSSIYGYMEKIRIYTNDGTPVIAYRLIYGYPGFCADCHGFTFLEGDLWIQSDDVPSILEHDDWERKPTDRVAPGDIVVYYKWNADSKAMEVVHSARVVAVTRGENGRIVSITVWGLSGYEVVPYEDTLEGHAAPLKPAGWRIYGRTAEDVICE